jgi:hypothetical protein
LIDNFTQFYTGGSGGGSGSLTFTTSYQGSNLTLISGMRHRIDQGDADGSTFSGTATLRGNWDGNRWNEVTPSLSTASGQTDVQIASISFGSMTFTSGYSADGTAMGGSTTGTCSYTITIDNNSGGAASASDISAGYSFYVDVALDNQP